MAYTKILVIHNRLDKCLDYAQDKEKTSLSLAEAIDYALNRDKTEQACFETGINCDVEAAWRDMLSTKRRWGKAQRKRQGYHIIQSFAPGEATPELAHEIGVKLAQRLWGERYQVLVATHLDKENHLHNHFVLNTVSFVDGIKYHRTEKDYHDMRTVSDTLCREYNLSVIQRPQAGKSKHYGEWRAEQEQRPTWRGLILSEIDELIRQSVTEKQFYYLLRQKGYEVKFGKDISVRPPGKERFVRLTRNFGEAYTAEAIRQRILQQPLPQPERQMTDKPRPKTYRVQGSRQAACKITGFRALYFYYCYKLALNSFQEKLTACEAQLENTKVQLENAKLEVQKPFPQEDELKTKTARLNELNAMLNLDKRENEIVDGERAEEEPSRSSDDRER